MRGGPETVPCASAVDTPDVGTPDVGTPDVGTPDVAPHPSPPRQGGWGGAVGCWRTPAGACEVRVGVEAVLEPSPPRRPGARGGRHVGIACRGPDPPSATPETTRRTAVWTPNRSPTRSVTPSPGGVSQPTHSTLARSRKPTTTHASVPTGWWTPSRSHPLSGRPSLVAGDQTPSSSPWRRTDG
jgi:hypothetical protein